MCIRDSIFPVRKWAKRCHPGHFPYLSANLSVAYLLPLVLSSSCARRSAPLAFYLREILVPTEALKQSVTRRLRILWIVLGALLLVSVTPLWLYHRQVLNLSEQKLQDTERVQQSEITRSLASETLEFEQNLNEQLLSQRQVLALTGWIADVDDASHAPQLARLLQSFVENNQNILYVTAVNRQAKGQSAGSFRADSDPFCLLYTSRCV